MCGAHYICMCIKNKKRESLHVLLFVSRFYIRVFCLQSILDVELNSSWRQREKLSTKK